MSENPILTWEHLLGEALLRFVLNLDKGPLENLSEAQQEVLQYFDSGEVLKAGYDPRLPSLLATTRVGDLPLAWDLRRRCGGAIPDPIDDDPLASALTLVARDCFCILLSPPDLTVPMGPGRSLPASPPSVALSQAIYSHPTENDATELIRSEAENWPEGMVSSLSGSDSLKEEMSTDSVVSAAAEGWNHIPSGDAAAFMKATADCLADLRHLAEGEPISIPAYIGLEGIDLGGSGYQLPFGHLRPPTDPERHFSPFLESDAKVAAILETTFETELRPQGEDGQGSANSQVAVGSLGRAFCLATAIERRDGESVGTAAAIRWITDSTPFQSSGSFRHDRHLDWVPVVEYDADAVHRLADWVEAIRSKDLSRIEIAVERVLRACAETEWGEALIDAVIAWENLLGTQMETTFRVTAALTILCEDDPALRLERRRELSKLYDKRSKLVHGETVGTDPEIRKRSIQIGLEAIARLIRDRPDLLDLAKSSARADRLLLGVGPGET